jgi:hypothetical protein
MKQERMTAAEYRKEIAKPRKNKMNNQKVVIDGIMFDSHREANHYCELKIMKKQGIIIDFLRQVNFQISDGYYDRYRKWIRPIAYRADFVIIKIDIYGDRRNSVKLEIHEPKGHRTQAYLNKKKLFQQRYPEYEFIEI